MTNNCHLTLTELPACLDNLLFKSPLSSYLFFLRHCYNIFTNVHPSATHTFIQMPLIIFTSYFVENIEVFTFKFSLFFPCYFNIFFFFELILASFTALLTNKILFLVFKTI